MEIQLDKFLFEDIADINGMISIQSVGINKELVAYLYRQNVSANNLKSFCFL